MPAEPHETIRSGSQTATRVDLLRGLMLERHTCRAFRSEHVAEETIRDIVTLAGRAASWCNVQPWRALITRPPATEAFRAALTAEAALRSDEAPDLPFPNAFPPQEAMRRRGAALGLYGSLGISREDAEGAARQLAENYRLFGAPHVAIVTVARALGAYAALDCGAFIGNFLLAAQAHNVAAAPQAALAQHARFIRRYFSLSDDRAVICGISFGYEDKDHPANHFRTARAPLEEILDMI